jgi:hypothetical protein
LSALIHLKYQYTDPSQRFPLWLLRLFWFNSFCNTSYTFNDIETGYRGTSCTFFKKTHICLYIKIMVELSSLNVEKKGSGKIRKWKQMWGEIGI